jgi:hypothetical protein
MRFSDLQEAGVPANFADHADQTLAHFKGLASKALGNVKVGNDKKKAAADKAAKDAERAKSHQNALKAGAVGGSSTIADIILDTTPEEESLEPIKDFDAGHLNSFTNEIEKVQARLTKFPVIMQKVLKDSDFLDAQDKKNIRELTSDQNENTLDAPEQLLMRDNNGEQAAWRIALTSDDPNEVGKIMLANIAKISRENQKRNLAGAGTPNKKTKTLAVGTALIRACAAQRQVLDMRLSVLKGLVDKMVHSTKPITQEQLKRVRKLLERMNTA